MLLDTDIVLPAGANDCVVLAKNNTELVSKILAFWKQENIEKRQQQCYQLWLKIKNTNLLEQIM